MINRDLAAFGVHEGSWDTNLVATLVGLDDGKELEGASISAPKVAGTLPRRVRQDLPISSSCLDLACIAHFGQAPQQDL